MSLVVTDAVRAALLLITGGLVAEVDWFSWTGPIVNL
jgi:hypothetical protein